MNEAFNNQKQRAIDEILKMQQNAPPQPPTPPKPQNNLPLGLDIPILNRLKADGDLTLVLGLLLLLLNEKADKRLLFALLYILL
ncbi:MAG: hypothetical protein J6B80_02640 [Clostridia bacterium]|nr:hypothetical protein [Clostridia bacterium]